MKFFRAATVFACLFFPVATAPAASSEVPAPQVQWRALEPGLELARVALSVIPEPVPGQAKGSVAAPVTASVTLARVDPAQFDFSLYMASEKGSKTLAEIGESENFAVAINAGMYQFDRLTSTGYLRGPSHTNNNHIAANFGAFFVAGPRDKNLPPARMLDRHADNWQTAVTQYELVMQNFRMATASGRVIWKQAERRHSVAAMSEDADGRILFILCATPVPAADFLKALQELPLRLATVMYLEGGSEAALLLNAGGVKTVEAGRHISGLWGGSAALTLPNVLGVRRKAR